MKKLITLLLICSPFLLSSCVKTIEWVSCDTQYRYLIISVKNEEGTDLLNPISHNSYKIENISVYQSKEGVYSLIEYNDESVEITNKDYTNFKNTNGLKYYYLKIPISVYVSYIDSPIKIEWSENDSDVIEYYVGTSKCGVIEKIWVNDSLNEDGYESPLYYNCSFIK